MSAPVAVTGQELPEYLDHQGAQLYVVSHLPAGPPRGAVVLAGPMSLERSHGYLTWVRWARVLAAAGHAAYRFDYRGTGESTGRFEEATFDGWEADLHRVAALAAERTQGPVAVCGLRLGALLGQKVPGAAGLLAWDPPVSGQAMLGDMLRRKLAADYMEQVGERKTREAYLQDLEAGQVVEVEGYPWSRGLWRSAQAYPFAPAGRHHVIHLDGRPPEKASPGADALRIPRPAFWLQSPHLVADLDPLFELSLKHLGQWLKAGEAR